MNNQIRHTIKQKTTSELLQIWVDNNHQLWTEETFDAVRQELAERGENIPDQNRHLIPMRKEEAWTVDAMKGDLQRWGLGLIAIGLLLVHFGVNDRQDDDVLDKARDRRYCWAKTIGVTKCLAQKLPWWSYQQKNSKH